MRCISILRIVVVTVSTYDEVEVVRGMYADAKPETSCGRTHTIVGPC